MVLGIGSDTLAVGAGATSFTLPTPVAFGSSFDLTVRTQPTGQTCSVANGSGTLDVAANATRFTMPAAVAFGSAYDVTVRPSYADQLTCSVADASGNVYVADQGNNRIRKVAPIGIGIAVGGDGIVYVTDAFNCTILRITPDGVVSTVAGTGAVGSADGPVAGATFNEALAVAVDVSGNLVVADTKNHRIRRITRD